MVLDGVRQAVEEQVDTKKGQAVDARGLCLCCLSWLRGVVECEYCDAARHGQDDEIFRQRITLAEQSDVQGHDGEQFAGFGEDEREIVDVGERGVAKRRGKGRGQRDEDQGDEGGLSREDVEGSRLVQQVETAAGKGKEGLDGVEDDRKPEILLLRLRRTVGRVGSGGDTLLEEAPGQEGRIYAADADQKCEHA